MEIAVESIASNLDISGLKERHQHVAKSPLPRRPSLPKMQSPSKSFELTRRIYLTVSLYLCYFAMGYHSGIIGPTLLHLQYLFKTDTFGISIVFLVMNVGYLIGSFLCAVLFDRINHELQFIYLGILTGTATSGLPWMPHLYYYYALSTIQMIAHGSLYPSGQVYMLKLWNGNSYQKPLFQGTHLMWSIGAFISPFTTFPFLVDLNINNNNRVTHQNISNAYTGNSKDIFSNNDTSLSKSSIDDDAFDFSDLYQVRYIYGIAGIVDIIAGCTFIVGFILMGPSSKPHNYVAINLQANSPTNKRKSNIDNFSKILDNCTTPLMKVFKRLMLFFVCSILVFFFWYENVIGSYIAMFSVKGLKWASDKGALASSIFYGCHGLGRLTGVFISKCCQPTKVIITNMLITTIAITFLLFPYINELMVLIPTAVIGFFVATTFPSIILWISDYMSITGRLGGMFMGATSIGCMTAGPLIGFLFQRYSHMWVVYVSLGSSVLCIGIFLGLIVLGHIVRKQHAFMKESVAKDSHENGILIGCELPGEKTKR